MVRYRFDQFTLSPGRRLLLQDGREVPLIPKYFDLLLLLIERRHEAVHRREIFDRVWADSIVSDSALSQAVRTIRRALGDDSKEPRFIRTVSRHGYRFVFEGVVEEREDPASTMVAPTDAAPALTPPRVTVASGTLTPDPLWQEAAVGGGAAGAVAGTVGGVLLALAPDSTSSLSMVPVLAVAGGAAGVVGGLGIGGGLDLWRRRPGRGAAAVVAATAVGGGLVGAIVQWLVRVTLQTLIGVEIPVGGALEGVAIGAATGVGLVLVARKSTPTRLVGMAVCGGLAGVALAVSGLPLVGGTLHAIAQATNGTPAMLAPLGRLMGDPDFGSVSRAVVAFCECACFAVGIEWRIGRTFGTRGR